MKVIAADIPDGYLISEFADRPGYHADAFYVDLAAEISLEHYIEAFYTTPLFKAERWVLRLFARTPSSDADAQNLAAGHQDRFAVWQVEGRSERDILLADRKSNQTKSWLAVTALETGTRVWFGSVVVGKVRAGKTELGPVFSSLMGAHMIYSRALLGVAARRMSR